MAKISLPFGLSRNNGEAVTEASEVDIVIDGQTYNLGTIVAAMRGSISELTEHVYTSSQWASADQDAAFAQYKTIIVTED